MQEVVFSCKAAAPAYSPDGTLHHGVMPDNQYFLLCCSTCSDFAFYSGIEAFSWDEAELEYPSRYRLDRSVPEEISLIYQEAKRIQTISPNAFAVLLRRALEALCDDRGVETGTLASRLQQLADRGEIPGALAGISAVLRELGNAGAHNTKQRVTVPLTWRMDEFFWTLIEYVYVAPHRLAEFTNNLKKYEKQS